MRMVHVVCIIHVTREITVTLALHMHRDISILGVCAWVWSSIISVDEWVVSSYFGRRPINDSRFKALYIYIMCVGRSKKETVNPLR